MVNLWESRKRLIDGDWREQTTKERARKTGRKTLLNEPGVLTVKCLIAKDKQPPKVFYGTASTRTDVKLNFREMLRNAVNNAIMSYYKKFGKTSPRVQVIDYSVKYFDELIKIKRVRVKNHYRVMTFNRISGKIQSNTKWKRNDLDVDINDYYKDFVEGY
jgi:hypothetical protein